jgi:ATP-dependent Clp protease ATP-binding subunit ClpA
LLLIGPSGSGKTATIEALPAAMRDLGCTDIHVFRVDCNELTDDYDVHRFLGAAPGLVGYTETPPLIFALRKPGCIVLLDEVEKAHDAFRAVILGLLDQGRVTAPDGTSVEAPKAVIAMTSNLGAEELRVQLSDAVRQGGVEQAVCREHLLREGWPAEFVGRIGSFMVFSELDQGALREVAEASIQALAREYGLEIVTMSPVLTDVVLDLADARRIGARALNHSSRDLLMRPLADAARAGLQGPISLEAGPPPRVVEKVGDLSGPA